MALTPVLAIDYKALPLPEVRCTLTFHQSEAAVSLRKHPRFSAASFHLVYPFEFVAFPTEQPQVPLWVSSYFITEYNNTYKYPKEIVDRCSFPII